MTTRNQALISVGSNIEPDKHIQQARAILAAEHRLLDESQLIRTAPEGITDQPDFLNGAWLVETELDAEAFNAYLKGVEDRLGRDRTGPKFGPRTLDLDVIGWNGQVVHHDYPARSFVVMPVDELAARNAITLRMAEE
jgi:2-amino-4-hydroxy-6-hydroxymethyldihydropteridine diphosphokinase